MGVATVSDTSRIPLLCSLYRRYLDDQDSGGFARAVARRYTQGTLERLSQSSTVEIRRASVLALGFLGDYNANPTVGRSLSDTDRTVRILAENGIRNVWNRAGTDVQRRQLAFIIRLVTAQQYHEAVSRATELIDQAGWFAEAWNQRAVAFFRIKRYAESIRDAHQALELNPYHYDAAMTMGQAYLELENPVSALECFRRAVRLNPNLEGARVQIQRLSRAIEGR